jgi:MinD superfamily P-loop ATPase
MKELVVISGKGGTGKTSIVASIASLARDKVLADCDVDAADLHLILDPEIKSEQDFYGGKIAVLDKDACTECGKCIELCRFGAISDIYEVDLLSCEGCGVCAYFCPSKAIEMVEKIAGKWFVSDTRYGPLVHAKLGIAEDNSGKLVSRVKEIAREIAAESGYELIVIDGSPGIGCPVIASIAGASLILIVSEPTVSGIHDMKRVIDLSKHFRIKSMVCINKYDLNLDNVKEIERYCAENDVTIVAHVPYDLDFTRAQIEAKSITEYSDGDSSREIRMMWEKISDELL